MMRPKSPQSIAWARNLVNILKDEGVWTWTSTGSTFRIDKQNHTLTLYIKVKGLFVGKDYQNTIDCFKEIGYKVQTDSMCKELTIEEYKRYTQEIIILNFGDPGFALMEKAFGKEMEELKKQWTAGPGSGKSDTMREKG